MTDSKLTCAALSGMDLPTYRGFTCDRMPCGLDAGPTPG